MFTKLKIENFKSIVNLEVDLGRFNVFIGENGCGKSNILEGVAFLSAAKSRRLDTVNLNSKGIRIAKPSLTNSCFPDLRFKSIDISLEKNSDNSTISIPNECRLINENPDDIYSEWQDQEEKKFKEFLSGFLKDKITNLKRNEGLAHELSLLLSEKKSNSFTIESYVNDTIDQIFVDYDLNDFLIYSINSNSLRGLSSLSEVQPLGIYGEGIDVLINNLNSQELQNLTVLLKSISWFDRIIVDKDKTLKNRGYNLGRSNSLLYFTDKFLKRGNKTFSAENANEGVLFLLFYFTLFISNKTPSFFAIDNIETALNPKLCRDLIKELAILAKQNNKQALITTHNPAILDGLNLNDDEQRLFVVKRSDEGHTKVERIKLKPKSKATEGLKLSELWMRGYLGGLPQHHF